MTGQTDLRGHVRFVDDAQRLDRQAFVLAWRVKLRPYLIPKEAKREG